MAKLEPLNYNSFKTDEHKLKKFLDDTGEFFISMSEDFNDYFPDYVESDKILWNQFMSITLDGLGFLKNHLNDEDVIENLSKHGLQGNQLYVKLQAIKDTRDEFLVAEYSLQRRDQILQEIIPQKDYNNKQNKLWNITLVKRRKEKKDSALKWFERLEILLDSLISAIPGGEFLKEGKDFLKKILFG